MNKSYGEINLHDFLNDKRFAGVKPLRSKALLSSPTMHGEEWEYMKEAYQSGWMTTAGSNIEKLEELVSGYMGRRAVALSSGTAAIHMAVKLAAEKAYSSSSGVSTPFGKGAGGSLYGKRVFCSDLTFAATVNPIVYEGGEPVFIDSEYDSWNMAPEALEKGFALFPDVRIVVFAHLYGNMGQIVKIRSICREHNAALIEDAAEALGAAVSADDGKLPAGAAGDYGVLSFNGNKIITGSAGGMLVVPDEYSYKKVKKWSTQSREDVPWYEHEELGYNYRISNVVAGVARGQWPHLWEHISQKKAVYEAYQDGLQDLPITLNPMENGNYWLSCGLIKEDRMSATAANGSSAVCNMEKGRSCPAEILGALGAFGCEGRPIWKPMHMQPLYRSNSFITVEKAAVSTDIFNRGFCLPSDNKLTFRQTQHIIEVVRRCFR